MKLFVGNLSFDVKDDDLRTAFQPFGEVASASIIKERFSGESRGFGFVEMPSKNEGQAAIDGLNGKEFMGREINVNEARPMQERPHSSSRGGFSDHGRRAGGHDGRKRRPDSQRGRKPRFNRRSF
jgi:RNA recognition motif-containing protein